MPDLGGHRTTLSGRKGPTEAAGAPDFSLPRSEAVSCCDDAEQPPDQASGARAWFYGGTLTPPGGQQGITAELADLGGSFGYDVTIATPR